MSLVGIADCDSLVHLPIGAAMPTLQNLSAIAIGWGWVRSLF
ncbi:MAG: hypothetical protein AB4426_31145 [Xenococcaceae cyanobacterium]